MNAAHQLQVLSRPECSLCDSMLAELTQLLGDRISQLQVIDITDDAALERKYGTRIPVLLIDDEFVCAYTLDHERLLAHIERD